MDQVPNLTPWISLGLGGVLAIGQFFVVRHLLVVTMPEKDRAHAEQMSEARSHFLTALNGIETKFISALDKHGDRNERVSDRIANELHGLRDTIIKVATGRTPNEG